MPRLRAAAFVGCLVARAVLAAPAAAQVADTLPADTTQADTVDQTARYLEAQGDAAVRLAVLPRLGDLGPRPPLTQIVFTRDSLDWNAARTVGDLLAEVPGVYLWRSGWIGRAEPANFQARGATSVEYYLDGLPYLPIGPDSVGIDAALLPLTFLERIVIERWPGQLQVRLYTLRHDRLAPRSRIGAATGDQDFTRYQASLTRRYRSGVGFGIAADYLDAPSFTGAASDASVTQLWVQGSYLPSPRFGVQYQLVRSAPEREAFVPVAGAEPTTLGLDGSRTDMQLRVFTRTASEQGPRFDFLLGRTAWGGGGVEQNVVQIGAAAALRRPTLSLGASAFYRTRWTPLDLRARAGWAPSTLLSGDIEAVYQRHDGDRSSQWIGVRAGLQLPAGFAVLGSAKLGEAVATPALAGHAAQDLSGYEGRVAFQQPWGGAEVGVAHTAEFVPQPYHAFTEITALGAIPATDWFTVSGRLAPLSWLTLDGWYSTPREGTPVGMPPDHAVGTATIRSRFLRTFPSGAFELKLQAGVETWGTGVIGLDASGAPIFLESATYFRSLVQLRLVDFIFYWNRTNLSATTAPYVPGFPIPAYGSVFGFRWEFWN